MNVSEILSPRPITIQADAGVDDALALMDDQDIRHLPVQDGEEVIGVVSDRDLLGVVGDVPRRGGGTHETRVRDVMQRLVVSIAPDADVAEAAREMLRKGVGCLPVLADGKLVGLVSEFDVMAVLARAAAGGRLGPGGNPPLHELQIPDLIGLPPTASFEEAAVLCREEQVRHIPILEESRLVGLLSDRDLRAAAGSGTPGETPVADLMSTELVTLSPNDPVARAAQVMIQHRISSVPLMSGDRLAGLITITDLLVHGMRALDAAGSTKLS
ncbi:MAG: CBS domain-containing protein [Planctomycetota bacterium]|jgi:CBS domain-containing protein